METFDIGRFHQQLDALFAQHRTGDVEQFLLESLAQTDDAGDAQARLAVLAELIGFYRSRGRHTENLPLVQQSLELALQLGLEGTAEFTTTLINAATELRAAHQYEQAEDLYHQAMESATATLAADSPELAALHNNLALLYQETNRNDKAAEEFGEALEILGDDSCNAASARSASASHPAANATINTTNAIDIASTHANLALSLAALGKLDEALDHARTAVAMFENGLDSAHEAAAHAALAQILLLRGDAAESVAEYDKALRIIRERYGEDSDYFRVTRENRAVAQQALEAAGGRHTMAENPPSQSSTTDASDSSCMDAPQPMQPQSDSSAQSASPQSAASQSAASQPTAPAQSAPASQTEHAPASQTPVVTAHVVDDVTGLGLSRAYWEECCKPMIAAKYERVRGRIAAGLVGHGSECYGFDDELSRDHDFGPGVCLWLTDEDYAQFGEQLQADYDALPQEFRGFGPRVASDHAGKRVGVFRIGEFFESITGMPQAPSDPRLWVTLDEPTLAAATNGRVFADPLGAFSHTRQGFRTMPDEEILRRVSQRLGMAAQAGQYNLPRIARRGDLPAMRLCVSELSTAVTSLAFLLNNPLTVGYMPYYKWQFAALRQLSHRPGMRLRGVCAPLEALCEMDDLLVIDGGTSTNSPAVADALNPRADQLVDSICRQIVAALQELGLTRSNETFLDWHRPYVDEKMREYARMRTRM